MKRYLVRVTVEYRMLWKNYFIQSLIAGSVVFIAFWILTRQNAVVVASIGATAFIIFAMPKAVSAKPRRVIGGHMVGLLCGSLAALIPHFQRWESLAVFSLAVASSMFLMVALDFEHPPASGTALGVAMTGFSWGVAVTLIVSTILFSITGRVFRRYLRDLT